MSDRCCGLGQLSQLLVGTADYQARAKARRTTPSGLSPMTLEAPTIHPEVAAVPYSFQPTKERPWL